MRVELNSDCILSSISVSLRVVPITTRKAPELYTSVVSVGGSLCFYSMNYLAPELARAALSELLFDSAHTKNLGIPDLPNIARRAC